MVEVLEKIPAELQSAYHKLTTKQKKFIANLSKANTATEAARLAGYEGKNISISAHRLLTHPVISRIAPIIERTVAEELQELKEFSKINKVSILNGLQSDIKEASKISDRVAARLGQAKILGLTKDTPTVNIGLFSSNNSQSKEQNSSQLIDTRPVRE